MSTKVKAVGGTHYETETGYEHWDWVVDIGMTYLPATATKYLARWQKKNGLQDLLKARTYLDKLIVTWDKVYECVVEPPENIDELNARFVSSIGYGANSPEARICFLLSDLSLIRAEQARDVLSELILDAQGRP